MLVASAASKTYWLAVLLGLLAIFQIFIAIVAIGIYRRWPMIMENHRRLRRFRPGQIQDAHRAIELCLCGLVLVGSLAISQHIVLLLLKRL